MPAGTCDATAGGSSAVFAVGRLGPMSATATRMLENLSTTGTVPPTISRVNGGFAGMLSLNHTYG